MWEYLLLGLTIGTAALVRPSFLLLAFPMAVVLLVSKGREKIRGQLLPVAVMFLGYALLITPWIVRNRLLVGQWINIHTGAGWTLYVSAQQFGGEISSGLLKPEWDIVVDEFNRRTKEAQAAIPAIGDGNETVVARQEVWRDKAYSRDAISRLETIPPIQYLGTLAPRLFILWSTADASPWNTGLFHRFQQLLHVTLFGLILVGCFLARADIIKHWPLWLVPVYLTSLHIVFHVEARYSVPARPFLMVYAGIGVVGLVRQVHARLVQDNQSVRGRAGNRAERSEG